MVNNDQVKDTKFRLMGLGICDYKLGKLENKQFERVFVIMNGPGTANLNWEKLNKELESDRCCVIVTNGFIVCEKLIDSENLIYLSNDPIIDWFLINNIKELSGSQHKEFEVKFPTFDKNNLAALEYDLESCKRLFNRKKTTLAIRCQNSHLIKIDPKRKIIFKIGILGKFLYRLLYVWHQDGSRPDNRIKRIGIRTWPAHSRCWSLIKKIKILSRAWYAINFYQTPNTFYRALDLACNINTREVCFVGRNSQISEWLNCGNKNKNGQISLSYNYFFTDLKQKLILGKFDGLLRELYYSSQYIMMLKALFPGINFVSLERIICYLDYFSIDHEQKYMTRGMTE